MDPFTIKEIATAATETMGGDIPNFKGWESAGKSFEKPEVSDFDDLGNDIPDFKKSEMSNHDVGGHLEGRQFGGEREGFDPVSAEGGKNIPDFRNPVETAEQKSPWDELPKSIDENTGRTKIELTSGADRETLNAVPPPGNADIRVNDADGKNYIDVQTDEAGRKVHIYRPELNIAENSQRDSNETRRCTDIMDGRVDENGYKLDDGGHLVADYFGGSSEQTNLVPMDSEVNRHGEYRAMEREIAEALSEEPPHKITDFEVTIHYDDDTQRPSGFTYSYKMDGQDITNYIDNNRA